MKLEKAIHLLLWIAGFLIVAWLWTSSEHRSIKLRPFTIVVEHRGFIEER